MDLNHCSVRSYSMIGGDVVKGVDQGFRYHFIRVHENLVQHPSYNISIADVQLIF